MKKGDVIQMRKELPKGSILIRNCPDINFAENKMLHIEQHYSFAELPRMSAAFLPPDGLCVRLDEDSYLSIQAKVNWVFENEMAIEYLDTGGMMVLDMTLPENQGWVCIHESAPVYQDSVEHMTDEELRASVEELRLRRISSPAKVSRTTKSQTPKVAVSAEDKALALALSKKSAEEILALKKMLGLVD
jgi:hypothetical protein